MEANNYFFDFLSICDHKFVIVHNLANSVTVILIVLCFFGSLYTSKRLSKVLSRIAIGLILVIGFSLFLNWYSLNYLKEKTSLNSECYNEALQYKPFIKALPHLR